MRPFADNRLQIEPEKLKYGHVLAKILLFYTRSHNDWCGFFQLSLLFSVSLDKARNDLISLISEGNCNEDTLDAEFAKIHEEEQSVNEKLSELRKNAEVSKDTQGKIDSAMEMLVHEKFQVEVFDNVIVRKLIDCVKVMSKTELLIIFKGGVEVKAKMEN